MTTLRKVPDDVWEELEQELPAPPSRTKGGRKRVADRNLLDAMLYVLWTGCPWRALSRQDFGPWQTVYDRFVEWKTAGVFERLWARCLHLYDQKQGIDWQWQAADGTYVRAPRGGKRGRPQSHRPRQTRL
jgi:putative transposase